jgi:hypothetical protein
MLIYPHRITPFAENFCDVCKDNIATKFICVGDIPFIGLQHCTNIECINKAKMWLTSSTINMDKLKETYGETIIIQRSNGKKESGWKVCSDAYKEDSNGPFWVKVKDNTKRNSKYISLPFLQAINSTEK